MKNKLGKWAYLIHVIGLILVFKMKAFGQTSTELACKVQAKEVAMQSYNSCVTEARQQQIETLRKEYQHKLGELKNHYNKELKKAAGKETAEDAPPIPNDEASIQMKKKRSKARTEKPTKGIAKQLPKKQYNNGPAMPVQSVSEEIKVVPVSEPSPEAEAAQVESETQTAETY